MLINVVTCFIILLKITAPLVQPAFTGYVDKPPMEAALNIVMKYIPTTNGKFVAVDDEDFEWLSKYKWYACKGESSFYAQATVDGKRVTMHRLILGLTDPKIVGDHIDHDGLNNTRGNLRKATTRQNTANQRSSKNSTSKYLGVYFGFSTDKYTRNSGETVHYIHRYWRAYIGAGKEKKYLGRFKTEVEAAIAYDKAALERYGEFANLNFKETINI